MDRTVAPTAVLISAILPVPKAIDRTFELFDSNLPQVSVKLLRFNAPAVIVNMRKVPVVRASFRVTFVDPLFSRVTFPRVLPALVIVPSALKNNCISPVNPMPGTSVSDPDMVIPTDVVPVSVPVNPVQLTDLAFRKPVTVTVTAPEAALKNTSSAAVGTACPPAPPEVSAHLVPAVKSQLAVPPTQ